MQFTCIYKYHTCVCMNHGYNRIKLIKLTGDYGRAGCKRHDLTNYV